MLALQVAKSDTTMCSWAVWELFNPSQVSRGYHPNSSRVNLKHVLHICAAQKVLPEKLGQRWLNLELTDGSVGV